MVLIPNKELHLSQIPLPESDYTAIEKFALSFNGYEHPDCADIANSRSAQTLTEYRASLFFEQRRYRHFGSHPTGEDLEYIRSLVEAIRIEVQNGEFK